MEYWTDLFYTNMAYKEIPLPVKLHPANQYNGVDIHLIAQIHNPFF